VDVSRDRLRIERRRIDVKSAAGLDDLADDQADGQGNVETTSKYSSDLRPTRPTRLRSPIEEMPCTTVQKITGAIIILISEMKPSPRGFSALPVPG
jgi:hypothetical protein